MHLVRLLGHRLVHDRCTYRILKSPLHTGIFIPHGIGVAAAPAFFVFVAGYRDRFFLYRTLKELPSSTGTLPISPRLTSGIRSGGFLGLALHVAAGLKGQIGGRQSKSDKECDQQEALQREAFALGEGRERHSGARRKGNSVRLNRASRVGRLPDSGLEGYGLAWIAVSRGHGWNQCLGRNRIGRPVVHESSTAKSVGVPTPDYVPRLP